MSMSVSKIITDLISEFRMSQQQQPDIECYYMSENLVHDIMTQTMTKASFHWLPENVWSWHSLQVFITLAIINSRIINISFDRNGTPVWKSVFGSETVKCNWTVWKGQERKEVWTHRSISSTALTPIVDLVINSVFTDAWKHWVGWHKDWWFPGSPRY